MKDQIIQHIKLSEAQGDAIEEIVHQIKKLLLDPAPRYEDLEEAYKLATGRGMRSRYIDRTLSSRPDDRQARIAVAEEIEEFLDTLRVR